MYIVFLNGPAKVGKTTIGKKLQEWWPELYVCKNMADPLKAAVHTLLQFSDNEINNSERMKDILYTIGYQENTLRCYTLKNLYIKMSEEYLKPLFGPEVFGHLMIKAINNDFPNLDEKVIIICDCGFTEEVLPLINEFSKDKCMLIRLYGIGLNFDGDSRSYVDGHKFLHFHGHARYENEIDRTVHVINKEIRRAFNI